MNEPNKTQAWMQAYVHAWASSQPDDIRALFTSAAAYRTTPFAEPWQGVESIVEGWIARGDQPDNWTFRYEVVIDSPPLAVVRGWTSYKDPPREYSNIFLIEFGDGQQASSFTEWWMQAPE